MGGYRRSPVKQECLGMATKKQIKNMVDLINEKYQFSNGLKLVWERGISTAVI
jgi:hypothetical protein